MLLNIQVFQLVFWLFLIYYFEKLQYYDARDKKKKDRTFIIIKKNTFITPGLYLFLSKFKFIGLSIIRVNRQVNMPIIDTSTTFIVCKNSDKVNSD